MNQRLDSHFQNYIADLSNAIVNARAAYDALNKAAEIETRPDFVDEAVAICTEADVPADDLMGDLNDLLEKLETLRTSARHVYTMAKEISGND